MKQEELLRLNICPFDSAVMNDSMAGKETEGEEKAHFIIMLRYLALFVQQCWVTFSIPQITECLKRTDCSRSYHPYFTAQRREILVELQKEILVKSGWSYGKGRLEKRKVSGLMLYSLKNITAEDWLKAALHIHDILDLTQKGFNNVSVTVCWNERVARYHNYVASNPEEVGARFQDGAAMMERVLRKLADPYALGNTFCSYGQEQYVMGYFEGRSDEGDISVDDMDYNFFVQAIFLHMLLACAEELFGLPKWEVEHEV